MSTCSTIGIINKDKTLDVIYCHWDGYPSHHTPILLNSYNNEASVRELIALGDICILGVNIKPTTLNHSFNNPDNNVVVAYHRDRNDKWSDCQPKHYDSINTLLNNRHGCYIYLFDSIKNVWKYTSNKRFRIFTKPINK